MPKLRSRPIAIACFGEALWDILPRGIFLGGAPLNVAYHASRLGLRALPISAIGSDFLGREALRRIKSWGLDTRGVTRRTDRATGTAQATLDAAGVASYRIARNVAWDRIVAPPALIRHPAPDAIVFGTLALRGPSNRRELARLFVAWPHALCVLDLNLRTPFDREAPIRWALRQAHIVKLNTEELGRMVGTRAHTPIQWERSARRFATTYHLSRLCVTAGARGAGLLWEGRWFWENARPVVVADTVGAGDAFLAALLAALLARKTSLSVALAQACRLGEFVAARHGATPLYTCDTRGRPGE